MPDSPFGAWEPIEELVAGLERIEQNNDRIRAFVGLTDRDLLLEQAADAAARRSRGITLSPIDGVAVGVKDNIDTVDQPTSYGSALYADRRPNTDATVVARLRAAGALIVGKTNLTELACGTEGYNRYFGNVVNPTAPERFPGGSSSGSAAAVAGSMVPLAVGSDTSCSIRNPAASCAVVGLKPTFGRVPTDGVSVCSKRLDHVGPMARTCSGAAALLAVIQDPSWPDPLAVGQQQQQQPSRPLRIGILTGPFIDGCEPPVTQAMALVIESLIELGHQFVEVDLGFDLAETDGQVNVLCRDMLTEYGHDIDSATPGLVSEEVRQWFEHYARQTDRQYDAAVAFQDAVCRLVAEEFSRVDVLLCPTARSLPALVKGATGDRADRAENCSVWNLAGVPSLNLPVIRSSEPPVGVLLNGANGTDGDLLALGAALEPLLVS